MRLLQVVHSLQLLHLNTTKHQELAEFMSLNIGNHRHLTCSRPGVVGRDGTHPLVTLWQNVIQRRRRPLHQDLDGLLQ